MVQGFTSESLRSPQVVGLQSILFACPCRPCQWVLSRFLLLCAFSRLVCPCPVIMPERIQCLSTLYTLTSLYHLPASCSPLVLVSVSDRESTRVFQRQKFWELRGESAYDRVLTFTRLYNLFFLLPSPRYTRTVYKHCTRALNLPFACWARKSPRYTDLPASLLAADWIRSPDHPARSESLYRLSYPVLPASF